LAHLPERLLRRKLYLDLSADVSPRWRVPGHVEVPEHALRPLIPRSAELVD
jgi:hypothetical protein